MKVMEYLESHSLDQLKEEYGIKYNQADGLTCLKYNQLESPKTDPIVRECRGLIIADDKVICQPLYRFFNYGEGGDDLNLLGCTIQEKHDGSLVSLYWYNDKWNVSTSGTPTANCNIKDWGQTFAELFWEALGDGAEGLLKNGQACTYTFELCSPYNKVVRQYSSPKLYLLSVRTQGTLQEFNKEYVDFIADQIGIERPAEYDYKDIDGILDSFATMTPTDEGYVAVDYTRLVNGSYPRCKIKNPAYVALHHMVDSLADSRRALMGAILMGEIEEIKTYFPEYTGYLDDYSARLDQWKQAHQNFADISKDWTPQQIGMECGKNNIHSSLIFAVYNGKVKDIEGAIRAGIKIKGVKRYSKDLLKTLDSWKNTGEEK